MKRKIAFMFINASMTKPRRMVMDFESGEMITVGVKNYDMACEEAKKLAQEGILLLELCGGFGTIGHAKVSEAVLGKMQVGVVRFDNHPGYEGLSGDTKWL
ncbi:DUF6506 family protein [Sinanaerobacter sp. ZZT-01]|uniref:DUF6506 family protein n=1 Tax=Sinanaerobacter sp. ZZT-01 TaxID=3111540 RepID=UPI002D77BCB3|nr:DUF6506 family protein [Sinanaerobacter sp. ZZT-01]WRR93422.1 DUF6506 family protein [Sinanaerobacter sp. ZZT-01]